MRSDSGPWRKVELAGHNDAGFIRTALQRIGDSYQRFPIPLSVRQASVLNLFPLANVNLSSDSVIS